MSLMNILSYEYDSYGPDFYCHCPEDDYCRCAVYDGLRVENIDIHRVLTHIIGRSFTLTPALEAFVDHLGLRESSAYDVIAEPSYYGEEVVDIQFHDAQVMSRIQSWIARHSAEVDLDGISTYLQEKGHTPTQGSCNAAVRDALKAENHVTQEPAYVMSTHDATVKTLVLRDIDVPNLRHFEEVEPREPIADTVPIIGVVVLVGKKYRLVDGYHRLKWAQEHKKSGRFIVLA